MGAEEGGRFRDSRKDQAAGVLGAGVVGVWALRGGLPASEVGVQPRGDQMSRSGEPESPLAAGSLGSSLDCVCVCVCVCVCARAHAPAGAKRTPRLHLSPGCGWMTKWLFQQLSAPFPRGWLLYQNLPKSSSTCGGKPRPGSTLPSGGSGRRGGRAAELP